MKRRVAALAALPLPLWAATATAATPPSTFFGLLQVVFGLAVVLAAIMGCAWLFRRLSNGMVGVPRHLRVVSAVMVGQRERVVIVELGDDWLVLGVTPHAVNLLSRYPRPDNADVPAPSAPGVEPFARWLKAALARQRSTDNDLNR
jgi:flagellar protein FliO/FliZ